MMRHQEHAVQWREWSEEPFQEARDQDKLVLLDIGAVWCHWCHVMDTGIHGDPIHTGTYSSQEVQNLINKYYIPIKVDTDKRPDINSRYNMGGWPTTAFLTANGEMIYGETYIYPERMIGLLQYIADLYNTNKSELQDRLNQLKQDKINRPNSRVKQGTIDISTRERVLSEIEKNYDPLYGGFGIEPKFPHAEILLFLTEQYALTLDQEIKKIIIKTLRGMDSYGMYDRYAGGFFRYSTNRDWSIPHFEKMLEDNAKLTKAYTMASIVFDDEHSFQTVRSAHRWLLSDMYDSKLGTFAGSQDADQEEKYYGKTLEIRTTLPTPYIDRTIYTNWNSLMISSLSHRYMLTREQEIIDIAVTTFDFLINIMCISNNLGISFYHYHVSDVSKETSCLLIDQSAFINAALDLYEATSEPRFISYAVKAANFTLAALEDKEYGGFYDIPNHQNAIGELSKPNKDINENSDLSITLIRLSHLTGNTGYLNAARNALSVFTDLYHLHSFLAAQYARAVHMIVQPILHIAIAGYRNDERTISLQKTAWQYIFPGKITETIDPAINNERVTSTGYKPSIDGFPLAYVCMGEQCFQPVKTPEELQHLLHNATEMRQQQILQVK